MGQATSKLTSKGMSLVDYIYYKIDLKGIMYGFC